jgi:hypothetical protein
MRASVNATAVTDRAGITVPRAGAAAIMRTDSAPSDLIRALTLSAADDPCARADVVRGAIPRRYPCNCPR